MAKKMRRCTKQRISSLPPCRIALLMTAVMGFLGGSRPCGAAGVRTNLPDVNWDYTYPYKQAPLGDNSWYYGSATFYQLSGNSGACGHPWSVVNHIDYAAVPDPRFKNFLTAGVGSFVGAACGQCYEVMCLSQPRYAGMVFCRNKQPVRVRITDYDVPAHRRWPNNHFDLKPSTFNKIADPVAGIINIKFKRVSCRTSGPKWTLSHLSNPYWHDMIIYDVPGVGSVVEVWAKPANRNQWYKGKRLWGSHFTFSGSGSFGLGSTKVKVTLAERRGTLMARHGPTR